MSIITLEIPEEILISLKETPETITREMWLTDNLIEDVLRLAGET